MLFSETHSGKLWVRINDAGDGFVVYVTGLARDDFDAGNSFILGFVREHRPGDHITDGINTIHIRPEMFVNFDTPLLVKCDSDLFCA